MKLYYSFEKPIETIWNHFIYVNFFFFQPNLAVYGNLANVRKGGESEAPPPIPAYTVDKPQPRLALFDVHSVFLFIRCPC